MATIYTSELLKKAHHLAFQTDLPNKKIAKKLKLNENQLDYALYELEPTKTITESFLDFFIDPNYKGLNR